MVFGLPKKEIIGVVFLSIIFLFVNACFNAGTQESETHDDIDIAIDENNADLFGQNLDDYVVAQEITGDTKGFLAKPKTMGVYPGVVMIHEWWGLNDNIKEMAKILAKEGYIVFAIDLYDGEVATDSEKARELATSVRNNPDKAIASMKNAVDYLKNEQKAQKIGSLGWCFGGGQSLQLSLNEELDATVIYYGSLVDDKEQLKNIKQPVLGIFGEEDNSIPVSSVKSFESALNDLGVKSEIYIYPGVGHAFANPSGSSYAKEETVDAWKKTIAFLNDNLRASSDVSGR